jgi:hypothetical protein
MLFLVSLCLFIVIPHRRGSIGISFPFTLLFSAVSAIYS